MKTTRIAIFSAIFVILIGFYYLYEVRWAIRQKEKVEACKTILDINTQDVNRISLKTAKGMVEIEKRKTDWLLVKPINTIADKWAVEQILNTLTNAKWQREIRPLPEKLADFGLANPDIEVVLSLRGPSGPKKILVGSESPAKNMHYVMVNEDERVLLVYRRFKDVLCKGSEDLRDRHVLRFKEDSVAKVAWRVDKREFSAHKKERKWVMAEPDKEKISDGQIKRLLWQLEGLRFKKIFEEGEHPISFYGLDKPQGKIALFGQNGKPIAELSFATKKAPSVSYYVSRKGNGAVYELSYDFVDEIPRPEEEK